MGLQYFAETSQEMALSIKIIFMLLLNVADNTHLLYETWIKAWSVLSEFKSSSQIFAMLLISVGGSECAGELDGPLEGLGQI